MPFAITKVQYESGPRELLTDVEFTVPASSIEQLKKQLVLGYKHAGRPNVEADAITVKLLTPVRWSIALEHEGKEFVLFATPDRDNSLPVRRNVTVKLPMCADYERLHEKLSSNPKSVNMTFRAYYAFHTLAGGSIESKVMASAWEAVREKVVGPKGEKIPHEAMLTREAAAEVQQLLRQEVTKKTELFVTDPKDRVWVLDRLEKMLDANLKLLAQPLDAVRLYELGQNALVWSVKEGKLEARATEFKDLIQESEKYNKERQELKTAAESLSNKAFQKKNDSKDFHRELKAIKHEGGAEASVLGLFKGSAKMHLDLNYEQLIDTQRQEFEAQHTLLQNKSEFASVIEKEHYEKVKGRLEQHGSRAKTLDIFRVSSSALTADAKAGGSVVWVNGVVTMLNTRQLPLEATIFPDVLAGLLERIREVESQIAANKRLQYKTFDLAVSSIKEKGKFLAHDATDISKDGKFDFVETNHNVTGEIKAAWITIVDAIDGFPSFRAMEVLQQGKQVKVRILGYPEKKGWIKIRIHVLHE